MLNRAANESGPIITLQSDEQSARAVGAMDKVCGESDVEVSG